MKIGITVLAFLAALSGFGCSGGPQFRKSDLWVELEISRQSGSGEGLPTICVQDFTLEKTISDPHVVGETRVGLGFPSDLRSEEPIQMILTDHLKKGLAKAGFKLGESGGCSYSISGQIERVWVNEIYGTFTVRTKASVRYDLIVRDKQSRFLWGDTIEGRHSSDRGAGASEDIRTLAKAMNKSVESIFRREAFWKTLTK